jgi:hypothetical protein
LGTSIAIAVGWQSCLLGYRQWKQADFLGKGKRSADRTDDGIDSPSIGEYLSEP